MTSGEDKFQDILEEECWIHGSQRIRGSGSSQGDVQKHFECKLRPLSVSLNITILSIYQ